MIGLMYKQKSWLKERGASVLAALVLVAILGAVLIVFQYARSSGSFAVRQSSLTATAAAPTAPTVKDANGNVCDPKTEPCPCNQTEANPAGVGATKDSIEQCLPGCVYKVIPGNPAVINAVTPPEISNPRSTMCTTRVCTSDGACATVFDKHLNTSLSGEAVAITAAGVTTRLIQTWRGK